MREKKNHLYVDSEERKLLLHSLVGLKISSYSKADIQTALMNLLLRLSMHL